MPYYRRHRIDKSQPAIVEALRAVGASVAVETNGPVRGGPDLWVGFRGRTFGLQVKSEKRDKLRETQIKFVASWRGDEVVTVVTPDDALRAIGALRDVPPRY